jgi:phosphoribosylcarboxyaminoimidazole (NCAIR) mutase
MTAYDTIRDTLTRLEQAGVEPPRVVVSYHRMSDEQATSIMEALDTFTWAPAGGTAGSGTVWATARRPGVEVNVFLADETRPRPDSPMLARVRNVIAGVTNRG